MCRFYLAVAGILVASAIVMPQKTGGLTQAQRVVLDNPNVIGLKLTPISRRCSAGVYKEDAGPFNSDSKIRFQLVAINNSIIQVDVRSWDSYAQNRPRLLRDNQEVVYRDGLADLLRAKDKDDGDPVSLSLISLPPGERKVIELFDMSQWYGRLEPGHYELSLQHRFVQGGKLVASDSIVFEVENKK